MNVSELIIELQKLDPDMPVVSPGYEGGYCDVAPPFNTIELNLNVNEEWYYGPHAEADNWDLTVKGEVTAVLIA